MEFYGGTINDNSASENGGAVYANYPVTKVTMENVEVSRNASGNDGGAVLLRVTEKKVVQLLRTLEISLH